MTPARTAPQRGVAAIALALAILAALMIVAFAAAASLRVIADSRAERVRLGWNETLGSAEEIFRRHPPTQASPSTLEFEQLVARLGIEIAPRTHRDRARPAAEDARAFDGVKLEVFGIWSGPQLERPERGVIDPPPAALVDYGQRHAEPLEAVRRHLLDRPTPVWESDLTRLWDSPLPNLLGQINLHKLLTAIALAELHAGDVEAALENVEASRRLAVSLHDSPHMIGQLVLIAATRMQVGVLRHVPGLPAGWLERMDEHDRRKALLDALKYEGWVWLYADEASFQPGDRSPLRALAEHVLRPYTRLCFADMSDAWRERMEELSRMETLCDRRLPVSDEGLPIDLPVWNLIGEESVVDAQNAVDRLARLELDLELMRLVQQADAARREPGEAWVPPTTRASVACPDDHWVYDTDKDGRVRIAFSREIAWPAQIGTILPARLTF